MKKYLTIIMVLFMAGMPLWAERIHPKAGTTSAPFLKLGAGARAISLAGSFCALADDASAPEWNPAGTSNLLNQQIVAMHHEHFQGITQEYVGYAYPTKKYSFGLSARGLIYPKDLERRSGLGEDIPEEPLTGYVNKFGGNDISIALNISKKVREYLIAGGNLKFIRQKIDTETGSSFAVDFGLLGLFPDVWGDVFKNMNWGAAVQNFGPGIKFIDKSYDLPLNFKAGLAYRMLEERLNIAADYNHAIDNYPYLSAGAEWNFAKAMSLRVGYRYKFYGNDLGDLSGVAAGIGIKYFNDSSLDYAFMPQGDLGNTHRISLTVNIGKKLKIPVKEAVQAKDKPQEKQPAFKQMNVDSKLRKIALRKQYLKIIISPKEEILLEKITCNAEFQAGVRYPFKAEYADLSAFEPPDTGKPHIFLEGLMLKHNLGAVNPKNIRVFFKVHENIIYDRGFDVNNICLFTAEGGILTPESVNETGGELLFEYKLPDIRALDKFYLGVL